MYSEKATKFCEIFTLLWSYVVSVQSKVKISLTFVAFSEYMSFMYVCMVNCLYVSMIRPWIDAVSILFSDGVLIKVRCKKIVKYQPF